jgi:hypothetical protein
MKEKFIYVHKTAIKCGSEWQAGSCTIRVVNIDAKLEAYTKKLNCEYIDIQDRKINGVTFSFICDDEAGLYNTPPVFSVQSRTNPAYNLVNSLLICKTTKDGKTRGLTAPEIKWVKAAFNPMPDKNCILID